MKLGADRVPPRPLCLIQTLRRRPPEPNASPQPRNFMYTDNASVTFGGIAAVIAATRNVTSWHETDMPKYLGDVRCWVNSGKHMLSLSFSGFDPTRTSATSIGATRDRFKVLVFVALLL